MKKTVTYSVVGRVNPADRDSGEMKYYAQSQARGEMGIREISERIHQMCTVTRADVMAVLTALEEIVSEGLQGGEIVRLGELGSLQLSLSGEGSDTEDTYTDSLIDKVRVLFRPGTVMQEAINNLAFEKVPVKYTKKDEEDGGLGA
ncbi:HU family DNA-binding protein [uncultured Bacteroides sp.]|uniref:HU family DNA-binding protein n=1 Tax=uncultured Bacteroides sp. TaxID=162156 RepID=UPI0015AFCFBA|nr:HU family DNA-binding protein [uncultured Bacteroides sp.]